MGGLCNSKKKTRKNVFFFFSLSFSPSLSLAFSRQATSKLKFIQFYVLFFQFCLTQKQRTGTKRNRQRTRRNETNKKKHSLLDANAVPNFQGTERVMHPDV